MPDMRVLTVEQANHVFKALASEQRRQILQVLAASDGEICACKLSEGLHLAPSTISHHMAILQQAGLARGRKEGTWVYYTLQRDTLQAIAQGFLQLIDDSMA